jgi:uncharacterized membrane protein
MTLHVLLGRLLRVAIAASALVLVFGGVFYLAQQGQDVVDFSTFQPVREELRTPLAIFRGAFSGDAAAVAQLGILLVMVTPLVREAAAAGWFIHTHDLRFAAVGMLVVALLLLSIIYV